MKELAWEMAETHRMMRRFYDRGASALGVTSAQWRLLLRLAREPGLKQVELAERLDVEPITACRIVDRLEDAGLVERLRDPDDRRAWRLMLTSKAAPILEKLRLLAEEMSAGAFAGLSPDEIETKVKEIICNNLEVSPEQLRPEASFIDDLKADSLDVVELVLAFEQEFKITIPEEDTEQIKTVKDATNYIKTHAK